MLSLVAKDVPPDSFRWKCPDCGWYNQHADKAEWFMRAQKHVAANHPPVPYDLLAHMENQLCQTLPPGWCMHDDVNRPRPPFALSWDDVKAGLGTFTRWVSQGCHTVTQEEANRRARICSACYLNTYVGGCSNCQALVQKILPEHKTAFDHTLHACAVCKCALSRKIWFPLDVLQKSVTPQQREMYPPSFCWIVKEEKLP